MNLIATGNTAEVFEYGEDKVLKLFKAGYPLEYIKMEFNNTVIMNKSPILTPKVYEIVEVDGRHGIVFQKISGTDLYAEFFKNPEDAEAGMRMLSDLAGIQKKLSSFETTEGISYKDFLRNFGYPDADKLPDGNAVCHGDLHPGNIIRTPDNQLYLIDFMNVCHGPKEYDVARTVVLITENNPNAEVTRDAYLQMIGMTWEQIEPFVTGIKWCRNKEMI